MADHLPSILRGWLELNEASKQEQSMEIMDRSNLGYLGDLPLMPALLCLGLHIRYKQPSSRARDLLATVKPACLDTVSSCLVLIGSLKHPLCSQESVEPISPYAKKSGRALVSPRIPSSISTSQSVWQAACQNRPAACPALLRSSSN